MDYIISRLIGKKTGVILLLLNELPRCKSPCKLKFTNTSTAKVTLRFYSGLKYKGANYWTTLL